MEHKNLKLAVKNFGPIREGEVEFKPLTVFIGPNNSGKSYMATLQYALIQALTGQVRPVSDPIVMSNTMNLLPGMFSNQDEQSLLEWERILSDNPAELNEELILKFQNCFDSGVALLEKDVHEALQSYFGLRDLSELIYQDHGRAEGFSINLFLQDIYEAFVRVGGKGDSYFSKINAQQSLPQSTDKDFLHSASESFERMEYTSPFWRLFRLWRRQLTSGGMPDGDAHYLPAGRSGLLQGWQAIAYLGVSLIGRRIGTEAFAIPSFPALAREFTQQLIEMMTPHPYYKGDEGLTHAVNLMEEGILRGRIELGASGILPEMTYESRGGRIPVTRSSSMVSELAPIHLWMSRLLKSGDLLIIDEPEAYLHPENQRLIAQVLVRLMNAGVQVVCTTHSSLILHQLSNHILATSSGKLEKVGFTEHDKLNLEDIGVYLFEPSEDGVYVKEVEIDSDFGISEDEFIRVAEQIGEETYQLVT